MVLPKIQTEIQIPLHRGLTYAPYAVAVDSSLNIYVADYYNHRIRKIKPNGDTVTIGGTGGANFVEDTDGVLSTVTSQFHDPTAVASNTSITSVAPFDASNNVYVADYTNHRIRKIKPNGDTATIGGTGVADTATIGGLPKIQMEIQIPLHRSFIILLELRLTLWVMCM